MAVSTLQVAVIFANLTRVMTEIIEGVAGPTAAATAVGTPDADSLAKKVKDLKAAYDTDATAFMANLDNIKALNNCVAAYDLLKLDSVEDISDATGSLNDTANPEG